MRSAMPPSGTTRMPSVISSSSRPGSSPLAARASSTTPSRSGWRSCAGETFTATVTSSPSARHAAACRQASRSTQAPSGTISPLASATGTNSPGATGPRSGWVQRSSASTPVIPPVRRSSCGW